MVKRRARGEGTVYYSQTQGLWVAQITLPNGKRKVKYSKTQKVVKDWLLSQREALHKGIWVENDKITLSGFIDHYMSDVASHTLRPRTLQSYESLIRNHIKPELGHIRLINLRPDHLQNFYSGRMNRGLAPGTVNRMHAIIHRCLKLALRWGLINRNVADLVDAPSPKPKTFQTLSLEQVKIFLGAVRDDPLYALYVLAISTGMREGEILGLMWEDIDFFSGTIHVHHSLQPITGKGLVLMEPKTEKSKRSIAVPGFTLDALWDHKEKTGGTEGFVFRTLKNTPIYSRNLTYYFKKHLRDNHLPNIRFHDLRHTAATLLLSEGVHPKVVQEMLGHARINITLDIYSHLMPDIQKEAAEKMNDMLR
jgi:integrase